MESFSDYTMYNITDGTSTMELPYPGPGVYKALVLLVFAFMLKLALTIFTFGMKVPCGLFIPSLLLGAIMGRIVGIGVEQIAYSHPHLWIFAGECDPQSKFITPNILYK